MTTSTPDNINTGVPMHFIAFHPDFQVFDHPRTPSATLSRAGKIALDAGIRYA